MSNMEFESSFLSEIFRVKPALIEALLFIKTNLPKLSHEDELDMKLIFSELLYNAVIHGNQLDSNKIVHFRVKIIGNLIRCVIIDEGKGFDHKKLIESFTTLDALESEHGRGIRLCMALTDSFEFNMTGNVMNFTKKVVLTSDE